MRAASRLSTILRRATVLLLSRVAGGLDAAYDARVEAPGEGLMTMAAGVMATSTREGVSQAVSGDASGLRPGVDRVHRGDDLIGRDRVGHEEILIMPENDPHTSADAHEVSRAPGAGRDGVGRRRCAKTHDGSHQLAAQPGGAANVTMDHG